MDVNFKEELKYLNFDELLDVPPGFEHPVDVRKSNNRIDSEMMTDPDKILEFLDQIEDFNELNIQASERIEATDLAKNPADKMKDTLSKIDGTFEVVKDSNFDGRFF